MLIGFRFNITKYEQKPKKCPAFKLLWFVHYLSEQQQGVTHYKIFHQEESPTSLSHLQTTSQSTIYTREVIQEKTRDHAQERSSFLQCLQETNDPSYFAAKNQGTKRKEYNDALLQVLQLLPDFCPRCIGASLRLCL